MTTMKTTTNPPTETTPENQYEYELEVEGIILDGKIRDLEMNIAFAESLATALKRFREDMIEARARVAQYARVGKLRHSWMLPIPTRRNQP